MHSKHPQEAYGIQDRMTFAFPKGFSDMPSEQHAGGKEEGRN